MAAHGKSLTLGIVLSVSFFVVLFFMFTPIFDGKNAFEASDNLFNTMSKGSTLDYIPKQLAKAEKAVGKPMEMTMEFKDGETEEHMGYHAVGSEVAANVAKILTASGGRAVASGNTVEVSMDMGQFLQAGLTDAQAMFDGKNEAIATKYGMDAKLAMFSWWKAFAEANRKLLVANKSAEAKTVDSALKKGIELGYNYAGIPAIKAKDNIAILTGSLVFYVIYTMWWGMAILYVFDGLGLKMKKGKKKEA